MISSTWTVIGRIRARCGWSQVPTD
jgi:hypothetical protein